MRIFSSLAMSAISCVFPFAWAVDDPNAQPVKLTWPGSPPQLRVVTTLPAEQGATLRLLRPFAVVADKAGRILVADPGHRAILVYDKQGAVVKWTGNSHFPLLGPASMALGSDGRLFVTDAYQSQVIVFDTAGKPVALFGKDVLKRPNGIAVDTQRGRIFVSDVRLHQILSFDLRTLAFLRAIGGPAEKGKAEPGKFTAPSGIAINSKGDLYVTDMWNCRVQIFASEGAFLQSFAVQCSPASAYGRPSSIAIDGADRVFVARQEQVELQVFDTSGKPLHLIPAVRGAPEQSASRTALAVDSDDRIYVLEQRANEGRVQIFAQTPAQRRSR